MAKFFVVLLCLTVIQAGLALKCKRCKPTDLQCKEPEDDTCPASPSDKEVACLTFIYKPAGTNDEVVEKKCVNRALNKKYDCVKVKNADEIVKCVTCVEDLCNTSGARSSLGTLGVVGVVVAILAPKLL